MKFKKLLSIIMVINIIGMIFILPTYVNAVSSDKTIDTTKSGSLTINDYAIPDASELSERNTGEAGDYTDYLTSIGATPLEGVTFKATRVVNETFTNGNNDKYYTKEGIILPNVNEVKSSLTANDGVFESLNTYTFPATNSSGTAHLSNLPLGIYLIQEIDEPSSVITKVSDYLISVPTTSSSGTEWNYNVVTYPKSINGVMLTYEPNNPLCTAEAFSEPRLADKTEPLTKNQFTVDGMFFLGWADSPSSKVPDYLDMDDFTMPNQDTTIYAVWGYTNSFRYYTQFKYSEPWGLNLSFAMLNPKTGKVIDYSKYDDYGMYIYPTHDSDSIKINTEFAQGHLTIAQTANDNTISNSLVISSNKIKANGYNSIKIKVPNEEYGSRISFYDITGKCTSVTNNGTYMYGEQSYNVENVYMRVSICRNEKNGGISLEDTGNISVIANPTLQEVVTKGQKAKNYRPQSLTFNDGSTDNYLTTTYDENIYTQNLGDDIYTVTYVTYKGRTFWGTVKNRCVEDSVESIIKTSQVGLTTYSEAEVKLATAIKSMYDAEKIYYTKSSNSDFDYPKGKDVELNKNIDIEWENGAISNSGTNYNNASYIRTKEYIDVSKYKNADIVFNNDSHYSYAVFSYDKNKKFIDKIKLINNSVSTSLKNINIDLSCAYIRIHIYENYGSDYTWTEEDYNRLSISFSQFSSGDQKPFTHLTSLRAIAPWGLKIQANPENADFDNYDDYGVITYTDIYNSFKNGKNSLLLKWEQGGIYKASASSPGNAYSSNNDIRTRFVNVSDYSSIEISNAISETPIINFYDNTKTIINTVNTDNDTTITIPANAKYMRIGINKSKVDVSYGENVSVKAYSRLKTNWTKGKMDNITGQSVSDNTGHYYVTGYNSTSNLDAIKATVNNNGYKYNVFWYDYSKEYISSIDNNDIPVSNTSSKLSIPDRARYYILEIYNSSGIEKDSLNESDNIYFEISSKLSYDYMINNDNCTVYSHKEGNCNLEKYNNIDFITAYVTDIYTYRLQQTNIYTCFYYIKDGKCYYSNVMQRNCLEMAQKTIDNVIPGNELSEAAGNVAIQMINLYRETYYYRNGEYPTDDYDGNVFYKEDYNLPTHSNTKQ